MNTKKSSIRQLQKRAKEIKKDILEIAYKAHVGHIGSALSIADILTVLYFGILEINPKSHLDSKDKFILSKGHAGAALYSTLHNVGFFSKKTLLSYCQDGGLFGTHPDYNPKLGIEMTTGSLGHGLSVGVGMALGYKKQANKKLPRVFVLLSDAELNEGSVWEAIMFASHHQIDNLTVVIDDNNYQAFGKTADVINIQPLEEKLRVFGWATEVVSGHDLQNLYNTFKKIPFVKSKPNAVIAKTMTAKGITFLENTQEAHYLPLSKQQYKQALIDLKKYKY